LGKRKASDEDEVPVVEAPGWNSVSSLAEEIYDPSDGHYKFAVFHGGPKEFEVSDVEIRAEYDRGSAVWRPIVDSIVTNGFVILPGPPEPYTSEDDLFREVMAFVDRWADIRETDSAPPGLDLRLFCGYIMLGWLVGAVDSYMILNIRGPSDVGKTRIATIGHLLSYRSISGSGASSYASLLRVIDRWRGNLYINEGDLARSGETQDIVKFLNSRYSKDEGVIWRCEMTDARRWSPECFYTFGPTIITTRQGFEDDALESRCYRILPRATTRPDIPLSLPREAYEEAFRLRCKLLAFRFKNLASFKVDVYHRFPGVQTRLNQVMQPLACLAKKVMPALYEELKAHIREINESLVVERAESPDGCIVRGYIMARMERDVVTALDVRAKIVDEIGRPPGEVSVQGIGRRMRGLGFESVRSRTADRTRCIVISWSSLYPVFIKYVPRGERERFLEWLVQRNFLDMSEDEKKRWLGLQGAGEVRVTGTEPRRSAPAPASAPVSLEVVRALHERVKTHSQLSLIEAFKWLEEKWRLGREAAQAVIDRMIKDGLVFEMNGVLYNVNGG